MTTLDTHRPEGAGGETSDFLRALRRHIWIPLVCAALLGGGAYVFAKQRHRDYQSTALLQVNDASIEQEIIGITNSNLSFENVVAEIPPQVHQPSVADRAALSLKAHPRLNAQQVLAATSVSVDQQTGLIPVTAKAGSPQDAARIANALAGAYVDMRQSSELAQIHRARLQLQALARARARGNLRAPAAASDLSSLTDRVQQLQLTEDIRPQSVVLARRATAPSSPSGLAPGVIAAFGAFVGLALGIGLAALIAQNDDRLRSIKELERAFGVPVLARIPRVKRLADRGPIAKLPSSDRETFRLLLARLRHARGSQQARNIALTSAARGHETSILAWYLAAIAAAGGVRTVLIEANQARPGAAASKRAGGDGHDRLQERADQGADRIQHENANGGAAASEVVNGFGALGGVGRPEAAPNGRVGHALGGGSERVEEVLPRRARTAATSWRRLLSGPRTRGAQTRQQPVANAFEPLAAPAVESPLLGFTMGFDVAEGRRLDVISSPSERLAGVLNRPQAVARALASLRSYELIVIDTPPLSIAADAVPFVRGADGVLVVCRSGAVDRERAEVLRGALDELGTPVFGLITVGFGPGDQYR